MQVLVVGGTGFLGGAVATEAASAGHDVSIFTRGKTPHVFPSTITALVGDRHTDLSALRGKEFDLVVDTCAFTPSSVSLLLDALSPDIGRYVLVSSGSVYSDCSVPDVDEDGEAPCATEDHLAFVDTIPTAKRSDAVSYGPAYGPLKRSAEQIAIDRLGDRALVVRSGLLVGAGDDTGMLTYWVRRVDQGGLMVAPGDSTRCLQFIDVRDAAKFIVGGGVRGLSGTFNMTGVPMTWEQFLGTCQSVAASDCRLHWIDDDDLLAAGVAPWMELPLWIPAKHKPLKHFLELSTAKAFGAGLQVRSIDETLFDILTWDREHRAIPLKVGLPVDKEVALLSR